MSLDHNPSTSPVEPMAIPPTPAHQPPAHGRSLSFSFAGLPPPNLPTGTSFASRPPASPPASAAGGPGSTLGHSPSTSSVLSGNSPITPSPILASALSLPSGAGFNPFFGTSPSSASTFAPAPGSSYGHHARSFSITGGAGQGKPVIISGFPGSGSAVADDDDDSPPSSSFSLPLRRPNPPQPVKLPAQLQAQVKPPSSSLTSSGGAGGHGNGGAGPAQGAVKETSAGRGHGVLRRLSLGANSLLSRPNIGPNPAQPAGPLPTTATVTASAGSLSDAATVGRARTTSRRTAGATGTGKKRGISPTGERILQGHF